MDKILNRIKRLGIIPVVTLESVREARMLAQVFQEEGLPCMEVTYRTDAAGEAIRVIREEFPELMVGAGTILRISQAEEARQAGAGFLVSPGLDEELVSWCQSREILNIPGCVTPGELGRAFKMGVEVVKFFPAEQAGGLPYIKAVSPVYPKMWFIPTGGIGPGNVKEYLSYEKVLACGGSWMAKRDLIERKDTDRIRELAAEAAKIGRRR